MLNFYQWCKTPSAFSKKNFRDNPKFFLHVFGRAPTDLQLCSLYNWKLSHHLRDIHLLSTLSHDLETRVRGHSRSSKFISVDLVPTTSQLTFHSNHRPIWHRFRDKRQNALKISIFSHPRVLNALMKGFPLEFGIGARVPNASMMWLPDIWKSFTIGLVILIQYRLWQTDTHPATLP